MDTLKHLTRKYKLNLAAPSPIELAKVSRTDLARLFSELGFTKGAEVGTWHGAYTSVLCASNPNLKLFGVDINSTTPKNQIPKNCKVLRLSSLEAAKKAVDSSLDFVYLDCDHNFVDTVADIVAWSKKVRPGGVVAGYDFFHYRAKPQVHTYEAVLAYTSSYRIAPLFVTDRNRERVRSWFWVKA